MKYRQNTFWTQIDEGQKNCLVDLEQKIQSSATSIFGIFQVWILAYRWTLVMDGLKRAVENRERFVKNMIHVYDILNIWICIKFEIFVHRTSFSF